MTRRATIRRTTIGTIATVLAFEVSASPALARTFNFNADRSLIQPPSASTPRAGVPAAPGSSFDWGYVAIGASGGGLALIGVAEALTNGRHRAARARARAINHQGLREARETRNTAPFDV